MYAQIMKGKDRIQYFCSLVLVPFLVILRHFSVISISILEIVWGTGVLSFSIDYPLTAPRFYIHLR